MAKPDEIGFNISGANVTLTTTTEKTVIASGPVKTPGRTHQVLILAWAELTLGTGTTGVTPRIRETDVVGGDVVGEGNVINNGVPAGETEAFFMMATQDVENRASVEYNLTLDQAGASADGTALQAGIVVVVL